MFFTLNSNLKNHLQKILGSPLPLILLGGIILIQYLYISILSGNIFQGDVFCVMERFTFLFLSEISTRFWLISILFLIAIWVAFRQSVKSCVQRNHWIVAIVFFLLFCAILIATNPIASQDVFWNLFQGEIFTSYHQNPYISAPENFSNEAYLNNIPDWKNFTMTHGPLWTLVVSSITAIFPNNIVFQILVLRIALFSVLSALIYFIINLIKKTNPGWAFPAFIALCWQPLLLVNTVNDCHNDILVGAGIIIGLFLITQSKYLKGCAMLWLAVLVKYIALLLFPLVAILIFRKYGLRASIKLGLKIILICAVLSIVFYYPFGYGTHVFNGLSQHSELFSYYTNLPPAPFWILAFNSFILQKNESNQTSAFLITQIICIALFILTYFYIISKKFYHKNLFKKGFLILSAFLILAPIWFMSWYLIWLIPLAIILGPLFTAFVLIWGAISFPYPFPLLQSLFPVLFFATITYILIKKNNIIINNSKYPATSWNKIAVLLKENRK
jgi:hypothetical protein